ncbi:hypothetical protein ZEAMMB73_Zm00001d009905, partial [Zea mays]
MSPPPAAAPTPPFTALAVAPTRPGCDSGAERQPRAAELEIEVSSGLAKSKKASNSKLEEGVKIMCVGLAESPVISGDFKEEEDRRLLLLLTFVTPTLRTE